MRERKVRVSKVIVVGGGAAGMLAALSAAQEKADVLLLEKNEKLGKKLYLTGKGRCKRLLPFLRVLFAASLKHSYLSTFPSFSLLKTCS